jgi:hypothetical protein
MGILHSLPPFALRPRLGKVIPSSLVSACMHLQALCCVLRLTFWGPRGRRAARITSCGGETRTVVGGWRGGGNMYTSHRSPVLTCQVIRLEYQTPETEARRKSKVSNPSNRHSHTEQRETSHISTLERLYVRRPTPFGAENHRGLPNRCMHFSCFPPSPFSLSSRNVPRRPHAHRARPRRTTSYSHLSFRIRL